ncbi:serine--tRNA ligase [Oceanibacterium hippocampi]|uniref:Serine--tRNA ligase n=1 Tax=Oceanibacterium hippocampi TaxID=745714 RepID=A0A1Y5U057_9PROT|nr:serine--tRNA ligase [Oceanibacterium hippocampi]SLN77215.1 Serine--tRNA ligase [Oceanibacterium hippocampi]
MLDLKWIREHPDALDSALAKRGAPPLSAEILDLDRRHRELTQALQTDQAARNETAKAIGQAKARGENADDRIAAMGDLKQRIQAAEEGERALAAELQELLAGIPNLPADDVPVGPDESANVELRTVGEKPAFDFAPKEHYELGEALGLMDFEAASRMSGARFVVLRGALARLERALANFMLDLHTGEFGYQETQPPTLVRDHALFGTGQLPKFADQQFVTGDGLTLIPTAEVPLTNMVREQILAEDDLPRRYTALTPCYRSEAGAAGRDTRGMLRQHQFYKVELVSITAPEQSAAEHERMLGCAEAVLKRLGIPYRVVVLSTGDMGFGATKTYDIEAWLPGQNAYREISSCSNCGDFQARRMNARYRPATGKGTRYLHSLNGSGLAVGRTLIAVLENYQQADGSIRIPEALHSYTGGMTHIPAP